METHLLAIQAMVLKWIGLGWLAFGLWLGQDPFTVAWRAALGAVIGMVVFRFLLDRAMHPVQTFLVEEEVMRQAHLETKAQEEHKANTLKAAAGDGEAARKVVTEHIRKGASGR
jgi:hypothetical protein